MKNTLYQQFLTFCKSQPANKKYSYMDTINCPLAQFGRKLFPHNKKRVKGSDKDVFLMSIKKRGEMPKVEKKIKILTTTKQKYALIGNWMLREWTFGELVERLTRKTATWGESYGL